MLFFEKYSKSSFKLRVSLGSTGGSFYLWVRDVLRPYFAHTCKCIESKTILIWPGCVGELDFHGKPERKSRRWKNPLKYFNFFIAWVRDAFVTWTLIPFGYYFPFFLFLFVMIILNTWKKCKKKNFKSYFSLTFDIFENTFENIQVSLTHVINVPNSPFEMHIFKSIFH